MRRFVQDFSGCAAEGCLGPELDPALLAAPPRYNIAVRKPALIVACVGGAPVALEADWGMIPAWSKTLDRKSTRLNSSHSQISYAVFCLKKKNKKVKQIV